MDMFNPMVMAGFTPAGMDAMNGGVQEIRTFGDEIREYTREYSNGTLGIKPIGTWEPDPAFRVVEPKYEPVLPLIPEPVSVINFAEVQNKTLDMGSYLSEQPYIGLETSRKRTESMANYMNLFPREENLYVPVEIKIPTLVMPENNMLNCLLDEPENRFSFWRKKDNPWGL